MDSSTDEATLEPSMAAQENTLFENLPQVRKLHANRAHGIGLTFGSAEDSKPMGPLKVIDVHKGDSLAIRLPVYWEQTSSGNYFSTLLYGITHS
jgi:hypothetical protein